MCVLYVELGCMRKAADACQEDSELWGCWGTVGVANNTLQALSEGKQSRAGKKPRRSPAESRWVRTNNPDNCLVQCVSMSAVVLSDGRRERAGVSSD